MNSSLRQASLRLAGAEPAQALAPSFPCGRRRSTLNSTSCQAYSNQTNGATMTPAAQSKAVAESQRTKPRPQKMTLFKALSFAGPAPELVNIRLAMVGLLLGAVREAQSGETFLAQAQHASVQDVLLVATIVIATMVPVMHSARHEPFGMFTPRAELTNGRAAAIGVVCLLALEYKTGVPFF
uniref:Putative early light-inducible protein 1 n=1 Tax=Ulva linza TaxID=63409 RepID=H9BN85_9CHLO|nr:putative early light-inducible protein 1 [Ulva linza]